MHEQNLRDIDWSRPVGIHCVDDRGYVGAIQNIKTGASSHGLACDTYAARTLARDGELEAEMPIGELAKVITKVLGRDALLSALHGDCKAEQSILAIGHEIVTKGEEIFNEAKRISDGNVDEKKFVQIQDFYEELGNNRSLFRGVDIEAASMEGVGSHAAIKRSNLAHKDHRANALIINTVQGTWLDAAEAYANGTPLYQYDSWAVPVVAEKINAVLHHDDVDGFVLASLVRTIAISRLLPHPGKQRPGVSIAIH